MEGCGIDLRLGDCLSVMRGLPSASVDAVVTDPPAGIGFMGKTWDGSRGGRDAWVAWLAERMAEALRVAMPGAHALVWALPRTSHWTAMALEDAGWVIEDRIAHIFGSGFPKHKSKLKPAVEDWWLATKPGGKKWLNVDGCRVATADDTVRSTNLGFGVNFRDDNWVPPETTTTGGHSAGRWPPNLALTHHPDCNGSCVEGCPVAEMDRQSGERGGGFATRGASTHIYGGGKGFTGATGEAVGYGDSGGASRFFPTFAWEADDFAPWLYCAKASRSERGEGNVHPTVKPLALCRWLVRLVTPPDGVVLDPFFGSATTALACLREGFGCIGIEDDEGSFQIASRRIAAETDRCGLFGAGRA